MLNNFLVSCFFVFCLFVFCSFYICFLSFSFVVVVVVSTASVKHVYRHNVIKSMYCK